MTKTIFIDKNAIESMNTINKNNQIFTSLIFVSIIAVLFIASYHEVISWWYIRCSSADSYYSHGFLIPFVSGFLIWQKRNELTKIKPDGSLWGLGLIFFSVLMHISGTILYVFSVSGFSIFFLIIGMTLFIYGKQITRIILFPLLFMIFMFPLPLAFINKISFPMKMLVAKSGTWIVSLMGIAIMREGFQITIPAGTLLVGNPCSGGDTA